MTLIEEFSLYIGTHEYNGIVAVIQNWFYGKLVKDKWCATAMSFFAARCGILDQLGGKNEGVWEMYNACKVAHKGGRFYDYGFLPEVIPDGAVCFFLKSGYSHVTVCYSSRTYNKTNYLACLGGNQEDSICVKNYPMKALQAIFVPNYPADERPVIKKGYKDEEHGGKWCATMQKAINQLLGANLDIDGSCGGLTDAAIRSFQSVNGLAVDGHCGPATWAKIDAMLAEKLVYVHTIPGGTYHYTEEKDGFYYVPDLGIWTK